MLVETRERDCKHDTHPDLYVMHSRPPFQRRESKDNDKKEKIPELTFSAFCVVRFWREMRKVRALSGVKLCSCGDARPSRIGCFV